MSLLLLGESQPTASDTRYLLTDINMGKFWNSSGKERLGLGFCKEKEAEET
jgi:hypothetical protein